MILPFHWVCLYEIMFVFNLLPPESVRQSKSYQQFILLARSSFLICFWLVIISIIVLLSYVILSREKILIQENSQRLVTYNNYVVKSGLGQSVKRLEAEVSVLSEVRPRDYQWLTLFSNIFSGVPEGVRVSSVRAMSDNGSLVIEGSATSRDALLNWQTFLQATDGVTMVDLPITSLLNKDDISFILTLTLKSL